MKRFVLKVLDKVVNVRRIDTGDYICLTDMVKGTENGTSLVENGLGTKILLSFSGYGKPLIIQILTKIHISRFLISQD